MPKYDYNILLDTVGGDGIKDLSATSVALCVFALGTINHKYLWKSYGFGINDTDWNNLSADIALALDEVMSGLVGLIVPAVFETYSAFKFLPCDGGVYNKSDYPKLYDVLDSRYIISGSQFTVPDMRDRFPVGSGASYEPNETGGENEHLLTVSEMPSHSHGYTQPTFGIDIESVGVPDPTGVGNPPVPLTTSLTGGNSAHENRPPFLALPFFIIAG